MVVGEGQGGAQAKHGRIARASHNCGLMLSQEGSLLTVNNPALLGCHLTMNIFLCVLENRHLFFISIFLFGHLCLEPERGPKCALRPYGPRCPRVFAPDLADLYHGRGQLPLEVRASSSLLDGESFLAWGCLLQIVVHKSVCTLFA
jgi:hypothetical protein